VRDMHRLSVDIDLTCSTRKIKHRFHFLLA
jgi:hypothetical protein